MDFLTQIDKNKFNHIDEYKILINLSNSYSINSDLIATSKSKSRFMDAIDAITGESKQRQDLINENFANDIENLFELQQQNEVRVTRISNYLTQTMDRLANDEEIIKNKFSFVENEIKQIKNELKNHKAWLQNHEKRMEEQEAYRNIDTNIAEFENDIYADFPLFIQIYIVLRNLADGEFGAFYDNIEEIEQKKLKDYLKNKMQTALKYKGKNDEIIFCDEKLALNAMKLNETDKTALRLISARHYDGLKELGLRPQISNLIEILTKHDNEQEILKDIQKEKHIANFMTYDRILQIAVDENLRF
ncbi:hypothetical protein OFN97_02570 [Campylobacter sp. VBCF_05 NA6]|uniref:hypothetical protein n=1 Tax=unclassified Campylobacter TaxID=2593542 RepID=UPI0022E9A3DF|nr:MULTISPECIES: hypothetical protein [unclassified Campylobacter]MDA3058359.1 hypothetical protein [Campylobacter sp. VBCF_04 NA7]MDA3058900.1 hypothetical protein [Campylobacter sp. VBCF_05 NA6]